MTDVERTAFADLADSLTPAQWESPSLCHGWKVRDVVAHLNEASTLTGAKAFFTAAKYGFRINTMLDREARKDGARPTDDLRTELRASVGKRRAPPGTKPADLVMETIVHQQDVRRAVGIPRSYPAEELRLALDRMAATSSALLPGRKRTRGLHLKATDLDWEHGEGDEVTGTAEALLMAMAGRLPALADLTGPGVDALRSRVAG
jgi:uncharacterized protein (TIGR03083 family)